MSKDELMREKMFASIASWRTSNLSQKEWCLQHEIAPFYSKYFKLKITSFNIIPQVFLRYVDCVILLYFYVFYINFLGHFTP